jgi:gamma-glutamyltranspeptidase/glutathione hydrolase
MRIARAGVFPEAPAAGSSAREGHGTTHFSIVDQRGNVVAMTSSIESSLGSLRFTQGFLLNNQLTDFSFEPADQEGPIANRVGPNKRPRSSMAPTLVFQMGPDGARGEFLLATGSPGGERIIQFVVKTLVAMLDWKLDPQQAAAFLNFGASNHPVTGLGGEHPTLSGNLVGSNIELATRLRALGHSVSTAAQSSGAAIILKTATPEGTVYVGGVDPRREGLAIGGRPPPLGPPSRAMPGP